MIDMIEIIEELGFKELKGRGWKTTASKFIVDVKWYRSDELKLYLDASGKKWILSIEPPHLLLEESIMKSFEPNIHNLTKAIGEFYYERGKAEKICQIRDVLEIN